MSIELKPKEKAIELIAKYGHLALDVAKEVSMNYPHQVAEGMVETEKGPTKTFKICSNEFYWEEVKREISEVLFRKSTLIALIRDYREKIDTMKENRAKFDVDKWTDAEIQECDRLIAQLAGVISDLSKLI